MDETLEQHLETIVEACRGLLPGEPRAIVLYGGYARGEGSWFRDDAGQWRPYNDYDIALIAHVPPPPHALKSLGRRLAEEIGIRWIDLCAYTPEALRRFKPTILHYDFKNASRVVFGDAAVLERIPEIDPRTLPMREAQTLYFTRLWTLLGSLPEKGVAGSLAGEASRFFRNQMAKAVLAVVDVALLARGAYDASYRERVRRMAALYPDDPECIALCGWALEEKLHPTAPEMSGDEVRKLYDAVLPLFFERMFEALTLLYQRPIASPEDVEFAVRRLPQSLLRRLYWVFRFRGFEMERRQRVQIAQSYIAGAYLESAEAPRRLERGIALLRSVDPAVPERLDWNEARLAAAELRLSL